jgi:hypothetical protein
MGQMRLAQRSVGTERLLSAPKRTHLGIGNRRVLAILPELNERPLSRTEHPKADGPKSTRIERCRLPQRQFSVSAPRRRICRLERQAVTPPTLLSQLKIMDLEQCAWYRRWYRWGLHSLQEPRKTALFRALNPSRRGHQRRLAAVSRLRHPLRIAGLCTEREPP